LKKIFKTLLVLVMLAAPAASSVAQSIEGSAPRDLKPLIDALNDDLAELDFLNKNLAIAGELEKDLLSYRRDERSFSLLADFDTLVTELAALPAETPQKEEMTAELAVRGSAVGTALLNRIEEFRQRIAKSRVDAEALSGGALIAAQAYIQSLESMRIRYYEALVQHMNSREMLGLTSEGISDQLEPELHLFAETLAGQIELTAAARGELQQRLEQDPANADITATLRELDVSHRNNLGRLESIIIVFDELGLDSAEYKAIMLQQTGELSISFFSTTAIVSVLKDGWAVLKKSTKENAPDVFFRVLLFLAVLFVFRILARIVRRVVRVASDSSSVEMSSLLKDILVSTSGGTVMALGVLMALSQVGISLAPMLAGLGVAGFIIGFALQDSLGNFAAGAMILIYRPFDVDDFVEVTGASGLVKKMNLVSTTITTFDNQTLVVPNSKIWGDVIKNVTAQKERRVDLVFGIGYDDDVEHAERVLTEIVAEHEKTLDSPAPTIKLDTLADSSVNFIVRPWVKTSDYWDVYWDLTREVKLRFDREGISIPFPQRDVHLSTEKPEQEGEEATVEE